MRAVDYVLVGAAVVVALAALDLAAQVRSIRQLLERSAAGGRARAPGPRATGDGLPPARYEEAADTPGAVQRLEGSFDEVELGFCVWSYRGGDWAVELNSCRAGAAPAPPAQPGEYEGQCVRTLCVRT